MNKFSVKGRLPKKESAVSLMKAFFEEGNFNPDSSIEITGNEIKMEILFSEKFPVKILDALKECTSLEFKYGTDLTETEKEEITKVETQEVSEQENAEAKDSNRPKQAKATRKKSISQKRKRREVAAKGPAPIPQLEEIAKKTTSFENFAELVVDFLRIYKAKQLFVNLLITAAETDTFSWLELAEILKAKGITFRPKEDATTFRTQLHSRFPENPPKALVFLRAVSAYKEYPFKDNESKKEYSEQATQEEKPDVVEPMQKEKMAVAEVTQQTTQADKGNAAEETKKSNESIDSKSRVRMECMPEIESFEKVLSSVDKSLSVEERVRYVLESMGLKKLSAKERHNIEKITTVAVQKKQIYLDIIYIEVNIPHDEQNLIHMIFSKFINDFVKKYGGERVKVVDFLSELQKVIMDENEIK